MLRKNGVSEVKIYEKCTAHKFDLLAGSDKIYCIDYKSYEFSGF